MPNAIQRTPINMALGDLPLRKSEFDYTDTVKCDDEFFPVILEMSFPHHTADSNSNRVHLISKTNPIGNLQGRHSLIKEQQITADKKMIIDLLD